MPVSRRICESDSRRGPSSKSPPEQTAADISDVQPCSRCRDPAISPKAHRARTGVWYGMGLTPETDAPATRFRRSGGAQRRWGRKVTLTFCRSLRWLPLFIRISSSPVGLATSPWSLCRHRTSRDRMALATGAFPRALPPPDWLTPPGNRRSPKRPPHPPAGRPAPPPDRPGNAGPSPLERSPRKAPRGPNRRQSPCGTKMSPNRNGVKSESGCDRWIAFCYHMGGLRQRSGARHDFKQQRTQTPPICRAAFTPRRDTTSGARRVRYRRRFSPASNQPPADHPHPAPAAGYPGPNGNAGDSTSPRRGEGCDRGAAR